MNKIFKISLLLILLAIIVVAVLYYPRLNLITGFAAKNMCSCTFISEREPANIAATDNGFEPVSMAKSEVNAAEKYASSEVFGLRNAPRSLFRVLDVRLFLKMLKMKKEQPLRQTAAGRRSPVRTLLDMKKL